MNRVDLQQLAKIRIEEAKTLLGAGQWPGAYYLSGYAIECALKACVAKQMRRHDFPPNRAMIQRMYTHDVADLLKVAALQAEQAKEASVDSAFAINWAIVKDWSEESRYDQPNQQAAEDLYSAVAGRRHGVLRWIRRYW